MSAPPRKKPRTERNKTADRSRRNGRIGIGPGGAEMVTMLDRTGRLESDTWAGSASRIASTEVARGSETAEGAEDIERAGRVDRAEQRVGRMRRTAEQSGIPDGIWERNTLANVLSIRGKTLALVRDDLKFIEKVRDYRIYRTYKVRHRRQGLDMVVKEVQLMFEGRSDVKVRKIDHPNIVKCFGYVLEWDKILICMEPMMICCEELLHRNAHQPIPVDIIGKAAVAVTNALDYMHNKLKIPHRSLKSSDVLFDLMGNVKLDLRMGGVEVRVYDPAIVECSAHAVRYLAPEAIGSRSPIHEPPNDAARSMRSNIWTLGVFLLEMALGRYPFGGYPHSYSEVMRRIRSVEHSMPEEQHVTPYFSEFLAKCMDPDPRTRSTAVQLKNHLFCTTSASAKVDFCTWYSRCVGGANVTRPRPPPRLIDDD